MSANILISLQASLCSAAATCKTVAVQSLSGAHKQTAEEALIL